MITVSLCSHSAEREDTVLSNGAQSFWATASEREVEVICDSEEHLSCLFSPPSDGCKP